MIAPVLHLHEGARKRRACGETVEQVRRRLAHGKDVADVDFFGGGDAEVGEGSKAPIMLRAKLLRVAEDEIDLRHPRKSLRLGLRGAA